MSSEEGFLNRFLFSHGERSKNRSDLSRFIDQMHSSHGKLIFRPNRMCNSVFRECPHGQHMCTCRGYDETKDRRWACGVSLDIRTDSGRMCRGSDGNICLDAQSEWHISCLNTLKSQFIGLLLSSGRWENAWRKAQNYRARRCIGAKTPLTSRRTHF